MPLCLLWHSYNITATLKEAVIFCKLILAIISALSSTNKRENRER